MCQHPGMPFSVVCTFNLTRFSSSSTAASFLNVTSHILCDMLGHSQHTITDCVTFIWEVITVEQQVSQKTGGPGKMVDKSLVVSASTTGRHLNTWDLGIRSQ